MAERLDGTVALVTGAFSGIGAATALELSGLGASVALVARRSERLEELATKISGQGGRSLVLPADITDEPQAREVVERTATELGRLDTLVNNVGVMLLGPVEDAPLTEWQRMININVLGLLYCTHAALPHLLDAVSTSVSSVFLLRAPGRDPASAFLLPSGARHGRWPYTVAIMPVRTNHLERGLTRRQKRIMAIIIGAVLLVFVGLGLWGSLARDSYSTSANGCVNVTLPSSTGGGVLHYCGAEARNFCHSSSVAGSSILAQHARPQCVLAGLLPSASAPPVSSH